jgi:hypothetical protein
MAWLCSVLDDSGQEASLGSETTQARIGLLCALCLWVGGVREAEVYMEGEERVERDGLLSTQLRSGRF